MKRRSSLDISRLLNSATIISIIIAWIWILLSIENDNIRDYNIISKGSCTGGFIDSAYVDDCSNKNSSSFSYYFYTEKKIVYKGECRCSDAVIGERDSLLIFYDRSDPTQRVVFFKNRLIEPTGALY